MCCAKKASNYSKLIFPHTREMQVPIFFLKNVIFVRLLLLKRIPTHDDMQSWSKYHVQLYIKHAEINWPIDCQVTLQIKRHFLSIFDVQNFLFVLLLLLYMSSILLLVHKSICIENTAVRAQWVR